MPALGLAPAIPLMVALMGLLIAAGLGGCLEEAADKDFKFDNPLDNTPADGDDDSGALVIAWVDDVADVVTMNNGGTTDQDMTSWTLEDDDGIDIFTFSTFEFANGQFVRVHTAAGTDGVSDVYGSGIDWSTEDAAHLINESGTTVHTCTMGDSCWP